MLRLIIIGNLMFRSFAALRPVGQVPLRWGNPIDIDIANL